MVEKLPPVRVTGVSKESGICGLCASVDERESKNKAESAQGDCASMLGLVALSHTFGHKGQFDDVITLNHHTNDQSTMIEPS